MQPTWQSLLQRAVKVAGEMHKKWAKTPSVKDKMMSRIMMAMMVVLALLGTLVVPLPAQAETNDLVTTNYDPENPPPSPESPEQSKTNPHLYDALTGSQVIYWGAVVDGFAQKTAPYGDLATLDTAQQLWDFIEDNKIAVNKQEAKILCLALKEGDPQPGDIIPNWPEGGWPNCGNVLDEMFGVGAAAYIVNSDKDARAVFFHLIGQMLPFANIKPTIAAIAGAGPEDLEDEDDETGDSRRCYTPENNIRSYDVSGCGVMCTVTRVIMGMLNTASEGLVTATANNANFQSFILATLTLYVTIYGAMVVLGLAQVALGDAIVRILKLSVVAMLLTSETVMTLFHMARCFFIEGTTYLVNAVMQVGLEAIVELNAGNEVNFGSQYEPMGNANLCGSSFKEADSAQGPLVILESLISQVFSAHMFLNVLTLALSSIYGIILAIFLIGGMFGFVSALTGAVTIYLTALIGQYLLLSLLPFFLVFLLFGSTKHLFEGYFKQLFTYSLTPIFLFAYISLFVVVVSAALAQLLDVKICWALLFQIAWVFDISSFQFSNWTTSQPMPEPPYGFFEVLIFWLLVNLMKEFENSVEQIARDIGDSYVYVNKAARELQSWFKGKTQKMKTAPVKAATNFAKKAGGFARGAGGGHNTDSSSGQKGVGGVKGGLANIAQAAATKGKSGG